MLSSTSALSGYSEFPPGRAESAGAEMIEIKDDDLKAFYERETQRGQKNIERFYS